MEGCARGSTNQAGNTDIEILLGYGQYQAKPSAPEAE